MYTSTIVDDNKSNCVSNSQNIIADCTVFSFETLFLGVLSLPYVFILDSLVHIFKLGTSNSGQRKKYYLKNVKITKRVHE
jgi:hypothetical protein